MKTIPLFFATDKNYLPFLSVSLRSVKENASPKYHYAVHVLHAGIDARSASRITALSDKNFTVEFTDVSAKLKSVARNLQLRDYYTCTTYYRIFIAELFPQYEKAIYLDSDTVILGDISELYNRDLGGCPVGAVPDETVQAEPIFCRYTSMALGIHPSCYFNAGVLLMNLKVFREEDFTAKFNALLRAYKFTVAQDQDYLNVLCKDRVLYIGSEWNKMPIPGKSVRPKLIHYNLTRKPWHYEDVLYAKHFWHYAQKSDFLSEITAERNGFTPDRAAADAACEKRLIELAAREANRPDNYYRAVVCKPTYTVAPHALRRAYCGA